MLLNLPFDVSPLDLILVHSVSYSAAFLSHCAVLPSQIPVYIVHLANEAILILNGCLCT